MVKHGGGEYVIAALVFTLSPVHDDAHYVDGPASSPRARTSTRSISRTRADCCRRSVRSTLIPAIKAVIGNKPLELHAHCTIGLAELVYMDAPDYGVMLCSVHPAPPPTAPRIRPLSGSWPTCARSATRSRVDDEALAEVGSYFTRLAEAEGLPVGAPQAFDAAYLQHQLPGGMVGTMRRHLAESRLSHLRSRP